MSGLPPLTVTAEDGPDEELSKVVGDGLGAHAAQAVGVTDWSPHWFIARDPTGAIQAGVRYALAFEWAFVHLLWVAEPYRKQGFGSALLAKVETEARERGCRGVYLDTFTFQAPDFYPRHGYVEFGRLNDFPKGHSRVWFAKTL